MKRDDLKRDVQQLESDRFDDGLDVKRHVVAVKDRLKKSISDDFVMAKLEEQQKTGINNLHGIGKFARNAVLKCNDYYLKYEWIKGTKSENGHWKSRSLNKEEKDQITKIGDEIFDTYMDKLKVIAILERNKKDNPLVNLVVSERVSHERDGLDSLRKDKEDDKK